MTIQSQHENEHVTAINSPYSILIADDEQAIRSILRRICKQLNWTFYEAESGNDALQLITEHDIQLFVLDVNMPGPSGNELAKLILEREEAPAIIIMTGYAEIDHAVEAVQHGVCNYIQKANMNISELKTILLEAADFHEKLKLEQKKQKQQTEEWNHIELTKHQLQSVFELSGDVMLVIEKNSGKIVECNSSANNHLGYTHSDLMYKPFYNILIGCDQEKWQSLIHEIQKNQSIIREFQILNRHHESIPVEISFGYGSLNGNEYISSVIRDISERKQHLQQLHQILTNTIHLVALTAEKHDPYTAGHQKRVAQLSKAIAEQMELSPNQIEGIYMGGLIHDIGKIGIPSAILSKPGKLYEEEFNLIKLHPQMGYDIVGDISFPWHIKEMVLQHHERLDGSGYPHKLCGDEIILEAKIMGVADVVEAVSSHRPYRPALGIDKALSIIKEEKGTGFEPNIVDICCELFENNRFQFQY